MSLLLISIVLSVISLFVAIYFSIRAFRRGRGQSRKLLPRLTRGGKQRGTGKGPLTLLTKKLNGALSNGAWSTEKTTAPITLKNHRSHHLGGHSHLPVRQL
jgi:hypothetical protein